MKVVMALTLNPIIKPKTCKKKKLLSTIITIDKNLAEQWALRSV